MLKTIPATEAAIVGYACRLPGAPDPDAFWSVLSEGRCTVGKVQEDRWRQASYLDPDGGVAGRSYTFAAGQIDDPWSFDPAFFGISPREAEQMDPQQRLLLQVTWEALERAGMPPSSLSKEATGIFVGASSSDYSNRFFADPAAMDAQFMTGNTLSLISNRLAYALDVHGPSYTVDTACSSGLFALHEAFQSLQTGVVDTAVVGAVNLLLSPYPFIGFSRATMLSRQGLCRAFDAGGDGYVRSEGAVVFVIKRLEAAMADGDRILGVLTACGVNSDGRTTGVSLPSPERQRALLDDVYGRFGVDPDRLAFLEAHGTGTRAGDPIETWGLGNALGMRRGTPLPIGSAKTNVGHLEAGSGLVGLLKAQMALENGAIPPSLHFDEPNPDIDFDGLNLRVVTESTPIPPAARPWMAGVNSFGFGGANAHAVLRQPTADEVRPAPAKVEPGPLILSARSAESLRALAGAMRDRLAAASGEEAARLANAAAYQRERLDHRLIALPRDRDGQVTALDAWLAEDKDAAVVCERTAPKAGGVAFVFSGNGAQHAGMGRSAYAEDPVFRASYDRVAALFRPHSGVDLVEALHAEDLEERLPRTSLAQPLIFAVQVAIVESLAEKGLRPDAVVGHSVGEVAAAWAAGVFDLPDAVRLIHVRSAAQEAIRGMGGMAAALNSAEQVAAALEEAGLPGLAVAADNSPRSVTLSGPFEQIDAFAKFARKRRIAVRKLDLDYPFHSPAADVLRDALTSGLGWLRPSEARIPYVSATVGRVEDGQALGPAYWLANIRQPVLFRQGVEALLEQGCVHFVEVGPRPVLGTYVRDCAGEGGRPVAQIATLEEGRPAELRRVAARALAMGAELLDTRVFGPDAQAPDQLPLYPWKNREYRVEPTDEGWSPFTVGPSNPLLGLPAHDDGRDWRQVVTTTAFPWLEDHKVGDAVVFPAAGYVDLALSAGIEGLGDGGDPAGPIELLDLDILRPLSLGDHASEVRVTLAGDRPVVDVSARRRLSDEPFSLHSRGRLRRPAGRAPAARPAPARGKGRAMTHAELYGMCARFGLDYGPVFARVARVIRTAEAEVFALFDPAAAPIATHSHALHPALLDAAMHGLFALLADRPEARGADGALRAFVPVRVGSLRLWRPGEVAVGAWAEVLRATPRGLEARLVLVDAEGAAVASVEGLRLRAVPGHRGRAPESLGYRTDLAPLDAPEPLGRRLGELLAPLGLTADEPAEPAAGALLMDTAAARVAWDALAGLADGGRLDADALVASGRLHATARPLFSAMAHALEIEGAAEAVEADGEGEDARGWTLVADCPFPPFSALVEALAAEAPRRALEFTALAGLVSALPKRLAEGLDPDPASPPTAAQMRLVSAAPTGAARWQAATRAAAAIRAAVPADRRLRVLILGAPTPAALDALHGAEIVISDPDPRRAAALELALPDMARPGLTACALEDAEGPFDLALAVDALGRVGQDPIEPLRRRLASGGALVAVEDAPALSADLQHGVHADWWIDTVDPDLPVGRQADAAGWTAALSAAGWEAAEAAPLASAEAQASLILAARPGARAHAEPTEEAEAPAALVLLAPEGSEPPQAAVALAAALGRVLEVAPVAPGGEALLLAPVAGGADLEAVHAACMAGHAAMTAAAGPPARVWVIGRGVLVAGDDGAGVDPVAAALGGFARVVANEHPATDLRVIDLDPADADPAPAAAVAEIAAPSEDQEIALRGGRRFGPRLRRAVDLPARAARAALPADAQTRLEIGQQGAIDSLRWAAAPRRAPADDEVEIEVAAAGLNFRDVMWAQGLLPEEALEDGFAGPTLGMECSGRVVRAGAAVTRYKPGDEVIAFAPSCFASHVAVRADAVAPLPPGVDMIAAATIPTTFLTAWYGLVELAQLRAGETVLIHGGAGGVGLAALQIALARGATVIATAGTPARRELLRALGAHAAFDSRSLAFAPDAMAFTEGRGVDVVLNSLYGEAMERSFDVLRPFGRFVELGKRDYYENTQIHLRPFRRNLSYFGVDADQLLVHRADVAERVFAALGDGFAAGDFIPLPHVVHEPAEIVDAFRLMQKSGHVGKIVVKAPAPPAPAAPFRPVARADGAYVVVGGLGGFGAESAVWLVEQGARRIWLTSRSGRSTEAARAAIKRMEAMGAEVHVRGCDAADETAMRAMLAEIAAGGAPLRGVIHAAMTLDDALLASLDAERIRTVLRPKIAGAAMLDRLTRDATLDWFVLYSSATTVVGNPAQAAYVAANAYLEGLAARRRAEGLPGLAMAWGAISDAGYLTRDEKTKAVLSQRLGGAALTAREALAGLGRALMAPEPGASATVWAQMDWAQASKELKLLGTPLFKEIEVPEGAAAEGIEDLRAMVEGLSEGEALQVLTDLLATETSRILRLPQGEIDPARPLTELGFDSLMAMDLRMAAEEKLGLEIPLMSLAGGASLTDVAALALKRVRGDDGGAGAVGEDDRDVAAIHLGEGVEVDAEDFRKVREMADKAGRVLQ